MQLGRRPSFRFSAPPKNKSLVASGERIRPRETDALRRLIQPWQTRAYRYYDSVPEIKFGAQFYSRMLAPLRLFAAEIDDKGEVKETDDPDAIAQVERIQDPGGGRSGILGAYGRLMFLGGEAYLTVTLDAENDNLEQWEMLSPNELRLMPDGNYMRLKAPSLAPENYRDAPDDAFEPMNENEAVVYRLWRRHPIYSYYADSTMQGVLDVCEELLWLTKAVKNRARSRLASAGILIINGQVTTVPIGGDTADENPDEDPFIRDLVEAMTAPIADSDSASAVVPMVLRAEGSVENIDNVLKHLQIVDPMQLYPEQGLRREAIERLAIGLDMPPEVLLGIAGVNHWSGWLVDEQSWKGHGQPIAQQFVDDLTAAFMRPTLRDEGKKDWQKYLIGFDPAAVINHPDRSKDAKDLHEAGALSDEALREANGFEDTDAPSKEEKQIWLGIRLRDSSVAIDGIPSVKAGGIEPQPGEIVNAQGSASAPVADSTSTAKDTPAQPAPAEKSSNGNGNGPVTASALSAKILGASDLALHRARELAGARLRSYAKRDREAAKLIDGVSNGQVAPVLGLERAKEIGAPPPAELVAGARNLIADTLRSWRIDEALAEPLGDRIEQHAARTLWDERPAPLPPRFENYVRGLEARAG